MSSIGRGEEGMGGRCMIQAKAWITKKMILALAERLLPALKRRLKALAGLERCLEAGKLL